MTKPSSRADVDGYNRPNPSAERALWLKDWFRAPRHLLVLFLTITLSIAAALGWLSWRLLQQDRALEGQRIQERLDYAADLTGAALLRQLSECAQRLDALLALPESQLASAAPRQAEGLSENSLIILLRPQEVESYPPNRLVYYPVLNSARELPASMFAQGEDYEFKQMDCAKAVVNFRGLAHSPDPEIRAGALLRLARNLRKAGQPLDALPIYDELGRLKSASLTGLPAGLVARYARCTLLGELNRRDELQREAQALDRDLRAGRWQLTRGPFGSAIVV